MLRSDAMIFSSHQNFELSVNGKWNTKAYVLLNTRLNSIGCKVAHDKPRLQEIQVIETRKRKSDIEAF